MVRKEKVSGKSWDDVHRGRKPTIDPSGVRELFN